MQRIAKPFLQLRVFSVFLRGEKSESSTVRYGRAGPMQVTTAQANSHWLDRGVVPSLELPIETPTVRRRRGSEVFLPSPRLPRRKAESIPAQVSPVSNTPPSSRLGHLPRLAWNCCAHFTTSANERSERFLPSRTPQCWTRSLVSDDPPGSPRLPFLSAESMLAQLSPYDSNSPVHDDRAIFQGRIGELPDIDIYSL